MKRYLNPTQKLNGVFLIFNPKVFVPVLSVALVLALSAVIYKEQIIEQKNTEEQVYAYADELLLESKIEVLVEIEGEAEDYEELSSMI